MNSNESFVDDIHQLLSEQTVESWVSFQSEKVTRAII